MDSNPPLKSKFGKFKELKNLNETFVASIFAFFLVFIFLSTFTSGREMTAQHKENQSETSTVPNVINLGHLTNGADDSVEVPDNYIECDNKPDQICV